jgi:hypothetical protein
MVANWRDDALEIKHKAYNQARAMGMTVKAIPNSILSEIRRVRQHAKILNRPERYLKAADFDAFRASLTNVGHAQRNRIAQAKFAYTTYLADAGRDARLCAGVLSKTHYESVLHSTSADTSLALLMAFTARVHDGAVTWRPCGMVVYKSATDFAIDAGHEYSGEDAGVLANFTVPGDAKNAPKASRNTNMNAELRLVTAANDGAIAKSIRGGKCAEIELLCGAQSTAGGKFWTVRGAGTALLAVALAELASKQAKGARRYDCVIMHAAHATGAAPASKKAAERCGFASVRSWWHLSYQRSGPPVLPAKCRALLPAGVYPTPRHYFALRGAGAHSWVKRAADTIVSGPCSFGRAKGDRGPMCK